MTLPSTPAEIEAAFGSIIGQGRHRDVFAVSGRPDLVLKREVRGHEFANVLEFKVWEWAIGRSVARWFAPCFEIAPDGRTLVMARTRPLTAAEWAALAVPSFFDDVARDNWGMLDGRAVCHDYAQNFITLRGLEVRELKPAASFTKWRESAA